MIRNWFLFLLVVVVGVGFTETSKQLHIIAERIETRQINEDVLAEFIALAEDLLDTAESSQESLGFIAGEQAPILAGDIARIIQIRISMIEALEIISP